MTVDSIRAVQALLERSGLVCQPEPDLPKGRKPDFYCSGAAEIWVEVKSLDAEPHFVLMGRWFDLLHERASKVRAQGSAWAYVSSEINDRDAKIVMELAARGLSNSSPFQHTLRHRYAIVPLDPDYQNFIRILVPTIDGFDEIVCCRSFSNKYGRPYGAAEIDVTKSAIIFDQNKEQASISPIMLGVEEDNYRVALELIPGAELFHLASVSLREGTHYGRNKERLRGAVAEANAQLSNACNYKSIPCLVIVTQEGPIVAHDTVLLASVYGDHELIFSRQTFEIESQRFSRNGAWNPQKNKTTSALCYIPNNGVPVLVHNAWAYRPFPRGLIAAREFVLREDGRFDEIPAPSLHNQPG